MDHRFKPVMQHQPLLLPPPDVCDLIAPDALVRVIDQLVDHVDRDLLDRLYPAEAEHLHMTQ